MQGFTFSGDAASTPSAGRHASGDSSDASIFTRLLEEVASRISFADDAAFYVCGPSGQILFVSAGYPSIAGAPPENGHIASDVFQFICNNKESYTRDEAMVAAPDGQPRHVRSYHYPLFDNSNTLLGVVGHYVEAGGQAAAMLHAGQDLSRMRDQLRASSDLFWELDAEDKLISLSDRATDILGKPAIFYVGMDIGEIGRFVDRSGKDVPPPQSFSRPQPFRNAIFLMHGQGNQPYYFHMSGVPVFEPVSGKFRGFRGVGVNVTERFQAEDAAAAAYRELENAKEALTNRNIQLDIERGRAEKALKVKTEFLATMSHELRTPLNAILGFSEAMTMKLFGNLSEQYAGYADDILKSGQHLLSLIDTMLKTAQIEGDEVSLNLQTVDIAGLIEQSVSIVHMRARAKNLDLGKAMIPPGWLVKADPLLATQILVNLLSNAVKFTGENGSIGIEITTDVHGGIPVAAITVWDTGIGISPDLQNRIFDKFVRGDNAGAYDDTGQGIGLGLHISKRLAELMQGGIRLQSAPGKGSRFTLELPLVSTP